LRELRKALAIGAGVGVLVDLDEVTEDDQTPPTTKLVVRWAIASAVPADDLGVLAEQRLPAYMRWTVVAGKQMNALLEWRSDLYVMIKALSRDQAKVTDRERMKSVLSTVASSRADRDTKKEAQSLLDDLQ
jgi:hypothetical protein